MFQSITLFGKTVSLYEPLNIVAYLSAVVLLLIHLKEYREFCTFPAIVDRSCFKNRLNSDRRIAVLAFLEAAIVFAFAVAVISPLDKPLSQLFLGDASSGYFPIIFFAPIVLFVFGVFIHSNPLRVLDYAAPANCIMLIIFKIACYCEGCCYGVEMASSPFFNHTNNRNEFPIQLVEIAIAVAIYIALAVMRKKRKRIGLMYPVFILTYCVTRFIFEFWRDDYSDVLGPMNGNQIMSLIGLALGIVYFVVVAVWGGRITEFFDTRNQTFLKEQLKIADKRRRDKKIKKKK